MKLLVTGGHITPALACIDEIMKRGSESIVFVGRRYNRDGETTESFEYKEITTRKIPFFNLSAGRLTREVSFRNLKNLLKTPFGFLQAYLVLSHEKPDVVLSFGGYLALPVAVVAAFMGITVYTHEQTMRPGLANRIISIFAKKVFVAFSETAQYFSPKKTYVTGNPIREQVFHVIKKPFALPGNLPVIYVTGGATGSHAINEHIEKILHELLEKYAVIHQVGNISQFNDFERLSDLHASLPEKLKNRYFLRQHITADEIGFVFSKADLVIGRSGANTFFELIRLQKPAILIPLPISAYGEQQSQAEYLQSKGVAKVFDQDDSSENLLKLIKSVMDKIDNFKRGYKNLDSHYKQDATTFILKEVFNEV